MIGRLTGRVVESDLDGTVVVDVSGVGYEVHAPMGTLDRAHVDAHGNVTLHVHTHAREDALELFAFASRLDRATFRTLLGISKIGPKLALSVLSTVSVRELAELVDSGQSARLTRIPGVGKKMAERMVLELRGRLSNGADAPGTAAAVAGKVGPKSAVLVEALVRMGFKTAEAERAVSQLPNLDRPLGELMREALSLLAP